MPDKFMVEDRHRSSYRAELLLEMIEDAHVKSKDRIEDRIYLCRFIEFDPVLRKVVLETAIGDTYVFESQRY